MSSVAIIGAGELGGALTHSLARRDRINDIWLIDAAAGVAAGKALDIQQAGAIEPFRVRVRSSEDVWAAIGASVIVMADSAQSPATEWQGERALTLVSELIARDRSTVIVCAGATQRKLIEQGVSEAKVSSGRLLGSAPGALVAALRAIIALEADSSPSDVSLSVHGIPPDRVVVAWSSATVGGYPITEVLEPPCFARVKARVPHLWPPGPYALAGAASRVCEAIADGRSRPAFSCFVALDGRPHARGRVTATSVRLGPTGVHHLVEPTLSPAERTLLDNALVS